MKSQADGSGLQAYNFMRSRVRMILKANASFNHWNWNKSCVNKFILCVYLMWKTLLGFSNMKMWYELKIIWLSAKFLNSQSLLEMGTKDLDFVQLNQLIGRKTGGISVYPFTSSVRGKVEPCSKIIVRGKAMSQRTDDLFNLVNQSLW